MAGPPWPISYEVCSVCEKTVKGKQGLVQHSVATGHNVDRCCLDCRRIFVNPTALEQHRSSSVHAGSSTTATTPPAARPQNQRPQTPKPTTNVITFRGNTYSTLPPADWASLYQRLLSKCHSRGRLRAERYPLSEEPSHARPGNTNPIADNMPQRKAVVLDCEMAGVLGNRSEAISVCAIDFLTGEVLLDSPIEPLQRVVDWRTPITGMTKARMRGAVAGGLALRGPGAARAALRRVAGVGPETVLVGQSLKFDLVALGMVAGGGGDGGGDGGGGGNGSRDRVVDSAVLAAEAVFGAEKSRFPRMWGLETLCRELMGLEIRQGGGGGGDTHDGLEDVLATREVVLWCLRHPAQLEAWGARTRAAFYAQQRKIQEARAQKAAAARKGAAPGGSRQPARRRRPSSSSFETSSECSSGNEVLRWEDVIDWETWPKSPPSSD